MHHRLWTSVYALRSLLRNPESSLGKIPIGSSRRISRRFIHLGPTPAAIIVFKERSRMCTNHFTALPAHSWRAAVSMDWGPLFPGIRQSLLVGALEEVH